MIGTAKTPGFTRTWAFAGRAVYANPAQYVKRAVNCRLTDVAICVNNIKAPDGTLATRARMVATFQAFRDAGISVHAMHFPGPTAKLGERAADVLAGLAGEVQLRSTLLDLEENFTQAKGNTADASAAFLARYRERVPVPFGVTGIVFHNTGKLGPLCHAADYVLPQGYSSTIGGAKPGRIQRTAHARWKGYGKPIVMGLAAYKQAGAGGLSAELAIRTAIEATLALAAPAVTEVAFWSLADLLPGTPIRAAVAGLLLPTPSK